MGMDSTDGSNIGSPGSSPGGASKFDTRSRSEVHAERRACYGLRAQADRAGDLSTGQRHKGSRLPTRGRHALDTPLTKSEKLVAKVPRVSIQLQTWGGRFLREPYKLSLRTGALNLVRLQARLPLRKRWASGEPSGLLTRHDLRVTRVQIAPLPPNFGGCFIG